MPRLFGTRSKRSDDTPRRRWLTPRSRRYLLLGALGALALGVAVVFALWFTVCLGNSCPSVDNLGTYDPDQAAKVYAADGRHITDLGLERRTVVPLDEMSPAVVAAFISTEDKRFYSHHGIDWIRVFGAAKDILVERRIAGGASTITMQLAGNLWPDAIDRRDRSLRRKIREAKVAREIEEKYSKEKILELYLNQINLGNRAYGVEAASQRYFGKSVREVNVAEAATLAAIPKAPVRYNPRRYPNNSVQRRNLVLGLMRDNNRLSAAEAERWKAYPLQLSSRSDFSGVAEYFVEYVRQILQARFGQDLYRLGYRVYTTLDLDMQLSAERALEAQLRAVEAMPQFRHATYQEYLEEKAQSGGTGDDERANTPYLQGLMVTLEAQTGAIRAMVGGRDFGDNKFNRVTQGERQPGSTFKPLVYSAALRLGYPLSQIVVDEPFALDVPGQDLWTPQNYDLTFSGPHTLRWHLYQSRNIPAIKLGIEIGEESVISEARRFGITSRIIPVPSISIGAATVTPLEMIAAYTAFSNLGDRAVPNPIERVEDRDGNIVWEPRARLEPVMSREQAWLMVDVLRDVVRRGTAAGAVGSKINFPAGGKTGTTNDYNDVWFVGFTPDLVTGVWMGFDRPTKIMNNAQGGRLAAPAWTGMMNEVYDRRPAPSAWARPSALTVAEVDNTTGYLAAPVCPKEVHYIESFIPGTEPTEYCPIHTQGIFNPFGIGAGTQQGDTTTPLSGQVTLPDTGPPPPSDPRPLRPAAPAPAIPR
ncbi:MAG TPA: PBP1A family penicillin-binding protein [Gemmatimonadales bacterium]|nr:PBP1A family penicillin-binding protein [Gemmatimonadales bacterium]